MVPLAVHVKHAAKTHDLQLDPDQPATVFKEAVYQLTGVPPDRMKIMIKGGVLKDDTDWRKVKPKEGQTFRMIGAAGELPKAPQKPVQFIEDMTPEELARAKVEAAKARRPSQNVQVGLRNLGGTCSMNATLQVMRAISELRAALDSPTLPTPTLASALCDLYASIDRSRDTVAPTNFLQQLRAATPHPGEKRVSGDQIALKGWDSWAQIIGLLGDVPGNSKTTSTSRKNFVQQYMMGEMRRDFVCEELPDETTAPITEDILEVECDISTETDTMLTGLMHTFDRPVLRQSSTLDQELKCTQRSRFTRLPAYLSVKMTRVSQLNDTNETVKNMGSVEFPQKFNALELVTDELKVKISVLNEYLDLLKDQREERWKARTSERGTSAVLFDILGQAVDRALETGRGTSGVYRDDILRGVEGDKQNDAEEARCREEEKVKIQTLVHPDLKGDIGCNASGLYDLVGIVAHDIKTEDVIHYTGFVKKSVFSKSSFAAENKDGWYKFDDDTVTSFQEREISNLYKGEEGPSAYILLYKTRPLE